jgi:hypothetical protein
MAYAIHLCVCAFDVEIHEEVSMKFGIYLHEIKLVKLI